MKAFKLSLASIIFLVSLFTLSPVLAAPAPPVYGGTTTTTSSSSSSSSSSQTAPADHPTLPINNGIVFLVIAGVVIGMRVISNKTKKLQPQKLNIIT